MAGDETPQISRDSAANFAGFLPGACVVGAPDDVCFIDGRPYQLERVNIMDLADWRRRHGLQVAAHQPPALDGMWPPHVVYEAVP